MLVKREQENMTGYLADLKRQERIDEFNIEIQKMGGANSMLLQVRERLENKELISEHLEQTNLSDPHQRAWSLLVYAVTELGANVVRDVILSPLADKKNDDNIYTAYHELLLQLASMDDYQPVSRFYQPTTYEGQLLYPSYT